jgi:ribose transport system substrate-binding protein
MKLPFIGCDGLPNTGQAWVKNGQLTATVFVPPNAGQAMEMIIDAILSKKQPPARVLVAPRSIPALNALTPRRT